MESERPVSYIKLIGKRIGFFALVTILLVAIGIAYCIGDGSEYCTWGVGMILTPLIYVIFPVIFFLLLVWDFIKYFITPRGNLTLTPLNNLTLGAMVSPKTIDVRILNIFITHLLLFLLITFWACLKYTCNLDRLRLYGEETLVPVLMGMTIATIIETIAFYKVSNKIPWVLSAAISIMFMVSIFDLI